MNPLVPYICILIDIYTIILALYFFISILDNYNIISRKNKLFNYLINIFNKLCEPSISIIKKYVPSFKNFDITPIVVILIIQFFEAFIQY